MLSDRNEALGSIGVEIFKRVGVSDLLETEAVIIFSHIRRHASDQIKPPKGCCRLRSQFIETFFSTKPDKNFVQSPATSTPAAG
jgi:hypothetical protein